MASSRERRKEERGRGHGLGRHGEREGCRRGAMGARPCCSFGSVRAAVSEFLYVREGSKEEGEREKKRKGRKRKEKKNMEKISNLKFFGEKNKRKFMKLVKIIFVEERYLPNYK
jgi:hypothetical protein